MKVMRVLLSSSFDRGFGTLCFKGFVVPHNSPQHRLRQSAGEPYGAPATGSGCAAAWTQATSASELSENSGSSGTTLQQDVESRVTSQDMLSTCKALHSINFPPNPRIVISYWTIGLSLLALITGVGIRQGILISKESIFQFASTRQLAM